jgi:hypothetical protein
MITEAGERLLAALDGLPAKPLDVARKFVLAIEAEAIAAERARITEAVEAIRPVLTDGSDDPYVSLRAVLRIVNPEEAGR